MLQEVIHCSLILVIIASVHKVIGENGNVLSNTFVTLNYGQNYSGKIIQSSPWKSRPECATRSVFIYTLKNIKTFLVNHNHFFTLRCCGGPGPEFVGVVIFRAFATTFLFSVIPFETMSGGQRLNQK